ncbi:MAG: hypothetical protein R3F20_00705 [Planctomycetota bacterium]
MPRNRISSYAGIALLAGSIILFQIALTRVFAILMWHHFTYMVVSIAMLGFGAAGSILTARREGLKHADPAATLATWSWAYGIAVMLAFCFATRVRIDTLHIWSDKSNAIALLLFYLIIAAPMLLGGLAIGLALTRLAKDVNRLYFADLLGSAAGGAASAFLLSSLGSTTTIMVSGALGALAGLCFSFGASWGSRILALPAVLLTTAVVIGFTGGSEPLRIPAMTWEVPFAEGKDILDLDPKLIESRIPSATAEVQVSANIPDTAPMIGGEFPLGTPRIDARFVSQDGTAPTMLYRDAAEIERFPFLTTTQAGSAYVARKARGLGSPEVLVIGVGGGVDVMVALANDAKHVTAVEINDAMVRMVTKDYADYIGGLFDPGTNPRVELVRSEGRSHLRHGEKTFDVIQMAGVDSFTALSTGAYTLSESYLYTVEAVKEFYAHLNEGGIVNYSRFIQTYPREPRETLRLANIARQALGEMGIENPASQIAVFMGREWASTMIKKGPFTAVEITALQDFGAEHGFRGFVYDPLAPDDAEVGATPEASSEKAVAEGVAALAGDAINANLGLELDVKEIGRLVARSYRLAFQGLAGPADDLLESFVSARPETGRDALRAVLVRLRDQALELGRAEQTDFIRTQRDFLTVLRGDDAVRKDFLARYPYDVSPCTDDAPFFFNYYRPDWKLGEVGDDDGNDGVDNADRYHSDIPVGHRVLYLSLAQIAVLAFLLVILPLRVLRREGVPTPGKWRYFGFFAALGVGFMFIEVALMQKMVIFLGHPTYSISVVLTSLLGFAGLGSLLAGRIPRLGRPQLLLLLLALLGALAFEVFALNHLLPRLLGQPLWIRIAAAIGVVAPLALVLGMPFPSGIRVLERDCPQLLPWGWAINGFLSVLASILCIILSQEIGFTRVFMVAGGLYAFGFLVMRPQSRDPEPSAH